MKTQKASGVTVTFRHLMAPNPPDSRSIIPFHEQLGLQLMIGPSLVLIHLLFPLNNKCFCLINDLFSIWPKYQKVLFVDLKGNLTF